MAQYKVPQDVEADDKLIGPFSFRQFVYLMISGGLIAVAFVLFQIFPVLVIIPIPFILFLWALALPLKKDQPMETYLSAVVDFYLKPQKRVWMPGQTDATITVTAPKKVEDARTKDLSQEEASHRLSFLANIVDTEGHAIKDSNLNPDFVAETADTQDMFESGQNYGLDRSLEQSTEAHHEQLVQQMRNAINNQNIATQNSATISHQIATPAPAQPVVAQPVAAPTPAPARVVSVPTPAATPTPPSLPAAPVIAPPVFTDVKETSGAVIRPDANELHEAFEKLRAAKKAEKEAEEQNSYIVPPRPEPEVMPEPEPKEETPASEPESVTEPEPEPAPEPEPTQDSEPEQKQDDQEVYISLH